MRNHAHSRERRKVEYFGRNCPGVVCVIEDVDRKSTPVKFGSGWGGWGPIRGGIFEFRESSFFFFFSYCSGAQASASERERSERVFFLRCTGFIFSLFVFC